MINTLPSYASQEELGLHVALEAEVRFNEILESVGISELHAFEAGVLTEAAEEKNNESIKTRFLNWLKKLWEDIKGLFDKVLNFIKAQVTKVKEKLRKLAYDKKENLKKKAEKLKATDADGKSKVFGKAHKWSGFDDAIKLEGKIGRAVNGYQNAEHMMKTHLLNGTEGKETEDYSGLNDAALGALGLKEFTSADIQKAVRNIIAGEEVDVTKKYILDNFDDLFKYATDFGEIANKVKVSLKKIQKDFDDSTKSFKDYCKKAEMNKKTAPNYAPLMKEIRKGKTVLVAISNATIATVKARSSESMGIILKLAIAGKSKLTNESAQIVPTAFQTELTSLFEI